MDGECYTERRTYGAWEHIVSTDVLANEREKWTWHVRAHIVTFLQVPYNRDIDSDVVRTKTCALVCSITFRAMRPQVAFHKYHGKPNAGTSDRFTVTCHICLRRSMYAFSFQHVVRSCSFVVSWYALLTGPRLVRERWAIDIDMSTMRLTLTEHTRNDWVVA